MAPKGRLRLWIVCVTAFVSFVALWNLKLLVGASPSELYRSARHQSKREVVEVDDEPRQLKAYSKFALLDQPALYINSDVINTQPSAKCPVALPSMLPCTCRSLARGIVVECTSPESRNALSTALLGLRDYVMSEAKLTGLSFELNNGDLDPMRFLSLQFLRANVRIRGEKGTFSFAHDFRTKTALRSVHFLSSSIDLGNTTLSKAPTGLTALEFLDSNFSEPYRPEWFAGLHVENLRILDSVKITVPIAAGLLGLKVYQHSKCALEQISEEFLPKDRSELRRLDFSINSLTSLRKEIFDDIPKLEEVSLASNKFSVLDGKVFRDVLTVDRFHRLDVSLNYDLECESLNWIENQEDCEKVRGTCLDNWRGEIELREHCNNFH